MTGSAPTASSALLERYDRALLGVFGTPRTVLAHGEGCYVWDVDGARYLDLLAGIAVNALGHAHPAVVAAVSAQAARARARLQLLHHRPPQVELAERLLEVAGAPPARRSSSPTPAPRRSRPRSSCARRTGRTRIVAAEGALPRPHHRCPRADRTSRPTASRSSRCLPDVDARAVRRRGRAARGGHRRRRGASSSSRSRARPA